MCKRKIESVSSGDAKTFLNNPFRRSRTERWIDLDVLENPDQVLIAPLISPASSNIVTRHYFCSLLIAREDKPIVSMSDKKKILAQASIRTKVTFERADITGWIKFCVISNTTSFFVPSLWFTKGSVNVNRHSRTLCRLRHLGFLSKPFMN